MYLFNLISMLFVATSGLDGNGPAEWVDVGKKLEQQVVSSERDTDLWVLFSKNLGTETFRVQLPADPSYKIVEGDGLELVSEKNGQVFSLTVTKKGGGNDSPEITRSSRVVQTEFYQYHFRTLSEDFDVETLDKIISSFQISQ